MYKKKYSKKQGAGGDAPWRHFYYPLFQRDRKHLVAKVWRGWGERGEEVLILFTAHRETQATQRDRHTCPGPGRPPNVLQPRSLLFLTPLPFHFLPRHHFLLFRRSLSPDRSAQPDTSEQWGFPCIEGVAQQCRRKPWWHSPVRINALDFTEGENSKWWESMVALCAVIFRNQTEGKHNVALRLFAWCHPSVQKTRQPN